MIKEFSLRIAMRSLNKIVKRSPHDTESIEKIIHGVIRNKIKCLDVLEPIIDTGNFIILVDAISLGANFQGRYKDFSDFITQNFHLKGMNDKAMLRYLSDMWPMIKGEVK